MVTGIRLVDPHRAGPPFAVGVLSILGTIPVLTAIDTPAGLPAWTVVAGLLTVGVVAIGVAALVGSVLARDVGLEALTPGRLSREGLRAYRLPTVVGIAVAAVTLAIHAVAASYGAEISPLRLWTASDSLGVLASVAGGVATELLLRFGVMTLVVWVTWTRRPAIDRSVTRTSAWAGIIVAAAVGAIAAIPGVLVDGLDPVLIARAAAVPLVGGIAFGYLYWRRDLSAAVVAHAVANLIRVLVAP